MSNVIITRPNGETLEFDGDGIWVKDGEVYVLKYIHKDNRLAMTDGVPKWAKVEINNE